MSELYAVVFKNCSKRAAVGMELYRGESPEEAQTLFEKDYPEYLVLDVVWTGERG